MALPHVRELARRYDAEAICLFVVQQKLVIGVEGVFIHSDDYNVENATEKGKNYLDKVASEMRAADIKVKSVVVAGEVVNTIVTAAQEENVDLVVMTSHGRSGVGRVFYGSVASGLLNRIDRPLLIIRSRTSE
jgi:nucleotide-binding universal stress UspA family protein